MALTKRRIVEQIQAELEFHEQRAVDTVDTLIEIIKTTLSSGEDVLISGFGKFVVRGKHRRMGRNPATGQAMMLRARRVVTFRCSGQLRRTINASPIMLSMVSSKTGTRE